jgi:hypothetical protein
MHNLTKFRQLPVPERKLLISAVFLLPITHFLLNSLGYLNLHRMIERLIPLGRGRESRSEEESVRVGKNVARIVSMAATHGFYRASCLPKSMVVLGLIRRQGLQGDVRFGVRMKQGLLEAHAWVEWQGIVINDQPDVSMRYTPLENSLPQTMAGL